MTTQDTYWKLQKALAHLANADQDELNTGGACNYFFFASDTQDLEFDEVRYYERMIESALHCAAQRCEVKSDDTILAKALKACNLK
jgi:hypothetical protein